MSKDNEGPDVSVLWKLECQSSLKNRFNYILETKTWMRSNLQLYWDKCFQEDVDEFIQYFLEKHENKIDDKAKSNLRKIATVELRSRWTDWNLLKYDEETQQGGAWPFKNSVLVDVETGAKRVMQNAHDYLWSQSLPFDYVPLEEDWEPTWFLDSIKSATNDWEPYLSFLASIVQRKRLKYALFLVGKPSSGKSPYIILPRKMLGKCFTAKLSMTRIGKASGLATAYMKKLAIDEDMNMGRINSEFFEVYKKLFGDDPETDIKLLYRDPFEVDLEEMTTIAGSNQLGKINDGVDENGLYKRIFPCMFDLQIFEDDDSFLEKLFEPTFMAKLFLWLLKYPIIDQRKKLGVKGFIERTRNLWRQSAYPIFHIIDAKYERGYDIMDYVFRADVVEIVVDQLRKDGIAVPTNIVSECTATMTLLGGNLVTRDKQQAYLGMKQKDAPPKQTAELDHDFEVPTRHQWIGDQKVEGK